MTTVAERGGRAGGGGEGEEEGGGGVAPVLTLCSEFSLVTRHRWHI